MRTAKFAPANPVTLAHAQNIAAALLDLFVPRTRGELFDLSALVPDVEARRVIVYAVLAHDGRGEDFNAGAPCRYVETAALATFFADMLRGTT